MSAPTLAPIPGVCRICGCTDFEPCVSEGGEACAWLDETQTICDFCDFRETPPPEEPRVVLATEGECARYIRALKGN